MKNLIISIIFLFLTCLAYGQAKPQKDTVTKSKPIKTAVKKTTVKPTPPKKDSVKKHKFPNLGFSPGIIYQKTTGGDINFLISRFDSTKDGHAFGALRLGIESNFKSGKDMVYAPKVGFELCGKFLCMRISVLDYMSNSATQIRLLPEIGLSFYGFANLTYGYNFKISNSKLNGTSENRICLSLNINRVLMKNALRWKHK